ncbi:hypothetical protein FLP10_11465 [Agromyces intestinalis]|uniref:CdiI immunity protein domain-containing protein n=1 Tax=Agromyces intestinalis TaxID=2592652 RepID=A0A5C1YIT2_9MICO|nr:contact-dependent growth inhibition system immunity protein [Agromyces intestinalis]QEO14967.1 hypothetical protein FLP10_11465 [Agromyces intestinalis]
MANIDSDGQLVYLARAYFHQDYDLEAPTPIDVVHTFRDDEPPADVELLKEELRSVVASHPSEDELALLWLKEADAAYDPRDDGLTMTEWFRQMLGALSQATG